MARTAGIWYRDEDGWFYTSFGGKQQRLCEGPDDSPDGPTALRALDILQGLKSAACVPDGERIENVAQLVRNYCASLLYAGKKSTADTNRYMLRQWAHMHGKKSVFNLDQGDVDKLLWANKTERGVKRGKDRLSPGSQRLMIERINAALSWMEKKYRLGHKKLGRFQGGKKVYRSRRAYMQADTVRSLLSHCSPEMCDFMTVLRLTGARQGELRSAKVEAFNADDGTIRAHPDQLREDGETDYKGSATGRERVIILHGEALDIVQRLIGRRKFGPIFRGPRGGKWNEGTFISHYKAAAEKAGIPDFTPHWMRHTFVTDALLSGMDRLTVAALVGDTVAMIEKVYAHLMVDTKGLRAKVEDMFNRPQAQKKRVS